MSSAAAVSAASMWQHWQGNGQDLVGGTGHHAGHIPPPHQAHHVHGAGQHELGDMLSMLGQNAGHHPSAAAAAVGGFAAAENLGGMFTGQFQ